MISVREAAEELDLSESYIRRLCREGALSATRAADGAWQIERDRRYLDRCGAEPVPEQVPEPPEDDLDARLSAIEGGIEALQDPLRALAPSPDEVERRRERERRRDELLERLAEYPALQSLEREVARLQELNRHLTERLMDAHGRIQRLERDLEAERDRSWWERLMRGAQR